VDVTFNNWQTAEPGKVYSIYFKTITEGDANNINDTVSRTITVVDSVFENQPPSLELMTVMPEYGDSTTLFIFQVSYYDVENEMPTIHELILDNITYSMTPTYGIPLQGMNFEFKTRLTTGMHSYLFTFSDESGNMVQSALFEGPSVFDH
jgi:hypothetical protein